ncbi:hypothetical protein [Paragemmobacter ruber]|uniref:Uncharacterized protein n=1 Tax=Paragemmobacter ruber TaxID=1985673 RepID=A0ABW9YAS6_9RHOB|nr:hypothetical protein [Rhodobacter ruber]NBE09254.1 hypothetical protein [Rhodobacter ruber]
MSSRLAGALLRAILMVALVLAPSMLVPGLSSDAQQTVALVALFAGLFTFVEYKAEAPGLIEFRDAPPFNRIRVTLLALTLLALSLIERGRSDPSTLTQLVEAVGALIGMAMDFPYSPVRLATQALTPGATEADIAIVRTAAGTAYLTSLLVLILFSFNMRMGTWPRPGQVFNVWINLPTFDPTSGPDIVARLERDARVNIALGFLLPFFAPVVVRLVLGGIDPAGLGSAHSLIWTMTAWAFLPASLFMRGIAMQRVARMIRDKRRENAPDTPEGMLAA